MPAGSSDAVKVTHSGESNAESEIIASYEHFTVDGTLLEAWAGAKSFQRQDGKNPPSSDDPGNPTVNFHGEKRSNQTHASKTDPEAMLARKGDGKEAKLSYSGNLLVENRNGLIVNAMVWEANGTAERDTALVMLEQIAGTRRVTVGGDKGFDTADFIAECRHMQVTPHVAQNDGRRGGSAIDQRTTRHEGYRISPRGSCLGSGAASSESSYHQSARFLTAAAISLTRRLWLICGDTRNLLSPGNVGHMKVSNRHTMVYGRFSIVLTFDVHDGDYVPG